MQPAMITMNEALPELCYWGFLWAAPDEQQGLMERHYVAHMRVQRAYAEEVLRQLEEGGGEGRYTAEVWRELMGWGG